jgi:hypothetical protein
MKSAASTLRVVALLIALSTSAFWVAKGAHRGWSQNRVPVKQVDEVTGLDHVTYEERFVPGIEFLGAGLALAAGLALVSVILPKKSNSQP